MNFVYMLRLANGSLYTGWTNDLAARVRKHAEGKGGKCTHAHRPLSLAYFEIYETPRQARQREVAIKALTRKEKDQLLVSGPGFPCRQENGVTVVTVPAGVHYLPKPLRLTGSRWELRGEPGAILSGCVPLTGEWEDMGGGVYRTPTDRPADALYIGGEKYTMARYPKYNPVIPIFGGFSARVGTREKAAEWQDPRGGYIHAMHSHNWGGYTYKILGKDGEGELILTGGHQNNRPMGMHPDFRYAENIKEEMTEPGEWFFDEPNGYVYVIPRPGADLGQAEIAVNACLLRLEGCEGVAVRGITFAHTRRAFMEEYEPLLRSDWTIWRGGVLYLRGCAHCRVEECTFEDLGSNALFADGKNRDIRVERSRFSNIGASAVCFVGRSDSVRNPLFRCGQTQSLADISRKPGPRSQNYPRDCSVEDCLIERVGVVEKQATGVEISMAARITVRNCTLAHTSRAAINISEGTFGGHRIEGCDVFDTVKETGDHGSFNSWGRDRFWQLTDLPDEEAHKYAFLDCVEENVIWGNRFRCDRGWDIDLDDGSSRYEIAYNLCLNGGIKLREGFGRHVHHNITVNNSIHTHVWYPRSGDVVEDNLVFRPYMPILMKVRWGKSFDRNLLHCPGQSEPVPAEELSALSGMDAHALRLDCGFRDPAAGDYRTTHPAASDFADFPTVFGVRYAPLRAIAPTPVLPSITNGEEPMESKVFSFFDMKIKNIETDGEMSAYATAGHDGVLVTDTDHFGRATARGLLPGDVILSVGGKTVRHAEDLIALGEDALVRGSISVVRPPLRMELPPK